MDALQNIMTRRSVRSYLDKPISDQDLETILRAGMAGPSCVNARDWCFLVTRDPEVLANMAEANGRPADPLKRAKLGILVLGDLERAFPPAPDYWVIDGAIAAQNMILAALRGSSRELCIAPVRTFPLWVSLLDSLSKVEGHPRSGDGPQSEENIFTG